MIVASPVYFGDTATRLKKRVSGTFLRGCTSLLVSPRYNRRTTRLGWRGEGRNKNNTRVGVRIVETLMTHRHQRFHPGTSSTLTFVYGQLGLQWLRDGKLATLCSHQFAGVFGSATASHQQYPTINCSVDVPPQIDPMDNSLVKDIPGFDMLVHPRQLEEADRRLLLAYVLQEAGCSNEILSFQMPAKIFVILWLEQIQQTTGDVFQVIVESIGKVRHFWHGHSLGRSDIVVKLLASYNSLSLLSKGFHYA